MEYAKYCADSCERHGLDYEYIDGIEFLEEKEAYKAVGVDSEYKTKYSKGHHNCHASHIKAWRRIIELDQCCIVLEHDAVVKGNVKNIEIPEMSVVTFGHRVMEERFYEPIGEIQDLVKINKSLGSHAYSITPETAKFLIDDAEKNKVRENIDIQLFYKPILDLYVVDPPQAVCWPRKTTREHQNEANEEIYVQGSMWNVSTSLTDNSKAGLKFE